MRLTLLITHFVAPAAYPIVYEVEPTDHAFVVPAPYPIACGAEPTDHAFRGIRTMFYPHH